MSKYYAKEFARNRWHICRESDGFPIYDNEPNGKDRPLIFRDEDTVLDKVEAMNLEAAHEAALAAADDRHKVRRESE